MTQENLFVTTCDVCGAKVSRHPDDRPAIGVDIDWCRLILFGKIRDLCRKCGMPHLRLVLDQEKAPEEPA